MFNKKFLNRLFAAAGVGAVYAGSTFLQGASPEYVPAFAAFAAALGIVSPQVNKK